MKNLFDMSTIHIEVTNVCDLECANCTRFVGHHRKPFFMDLDTVRKGLESLEGFKGNIGIMGGEPTLHKQFKEICYLVQELVPNKSQRGLWTNGFNWDKYEDLIYETFDKDMIIYNDHKDETEVHQPLMIAAKDVVEDEKLMWELIDKCWINDRWAASITPKGGFFCEVAAAQDLLFDGPGGYEIEKGWWNKTPDEFRDQIERACVNCSAAIPMPSFENPMFSISQKDLVSPSIAEKLEKSQSPRCAKGNTVLFKKKFTKEEIKKNAETWMPWSHRAFKQYSPEFIIYER